MKDRRQSTPAPSSDMSRIASLGKWSSQCSLSLGAQPSQSDYSSCCCGLRLRGRCVAPGTQKWPSDTALLGIMPIKLHV